MDRLEEALAAAAPPALAEAASAAGCPPDGVRDLERAGRIVVLEPDLAYASITYRELDRDGAGPGRDRAADPGRVPRRDRDEPQVRDGRSSTTSTAAGSCAGRRLATFPAPRARS